MQNNVTQTLLEMFEFQSKTNSIAVGEDWIEQQLPWTNAIIAETGEYLDSVAYKWWKKQEVDITNAKMELVDIWHFLMSKIISDLQNYELIEDIDLKEVANHITYEISTGFDRDINGYFLPTDVSKFIHIVTSEFFTEAESDTIQHAVIEFANLCSSIQLGWNEFVQLYFCKNALNNLRQAYGYKEGTYKKEWTFDGSTFEDNYVAIKITEGLTNYNDIYSKLESYYTSQ